VNSLNSVAILNPSGDFGSTIPPFRDGRESEESFAADRLLLPYSKGYGSGLRLLGMTFRKYVVTTDTGAANEYLRNYPLNTLLARRI
jgi:hypothetical protein